MVYFPDFITRDGHRDVSGKMVAITHTKASPRVGEGGTDSQRIGEDNRLKGDTPVVAGGIGYAV